MTDRLPSFLFIVVRRLLAAVTRPSTRGVERLDPAAPYVYVLQYRSLTDLVMLDIAAAANGLPRPRTSLAPAGIPERQRYFFLTRAVGGLLQRNVMRTYPRRLQRLQRIHRDHPDSALALVPVSIFWSRAPSKERSLIRVLLSENWALTGRFRRLVVILFNRHDITVQFGQPLSLRALDDGSLPENLLTRRIARNLRVSFRNARAALLGPDLSHRRTLVQRITSSRNVRDAIRAEAARTGQALYKPLRRAQRDAYGIASDVSYVTVRFFDRALTWFWNRIYDGMEVNGIERVKTLAETATLVYVPCHRSHVDYLVLSYVLYYQGLMIPHIAAGDNLNMPLVGPLLRRGGAFFMRRRFADDPLYAAVFAEYLYQMFQRGSPVEYFIEGGRSRTGRPLPPRTGLLAMTLASHARGVRRPIVFVPVYIGYEKLIEARSYLSELAGSAKQKESVLDIVRTLRVVRERFGRVHVNFGEPLPLADRAIPPGEPPQVAARALGRELLVRINDAADVNAVNLLALVLLGTPRLAMDEASLAEQLECFAALLRVAGTATVTAMSGHEMIAHAQALGMLRREQHAFGDVLSVDERGAVLLTWYRNNALHTLALPSLIACLVLHRRRPLPVESLCRMVDTVFPYLAAELFVRFDGDSQRTVNEWLDRLVALDLLRRTKDGGVWAPAAATGAAYRLELLADVALPILERFFIVVARLVQAGAGALDRVTLESQCQGIARRISRLQGLNSPEFFDARLFHGFVDTLIERGAVGLGEQDRLGIAPVVQEVVRAAGPVLPVGFRHAVLRAAADTAQVAPMASAEPR
jgi:glycerol-3-phosphate O-acyltransferase